MSLDNDTIDEYESEDGFDTNFGQYLTLQILMIISLPCYFFNFYHLFTNRVLRRETQNHVIILFLITNFFIVIVDLPSILSILRTGLLWSRAKSFCFFYLFIDYYLFAASLLVMAYASFERHILIFHNNFLSTRSKRIFIRYLPMSFCIIYPFIFYIFVFLLFPSTSHYDPTTKICADDSYLSDNLILTMYDTIGNGTIPTFLIIIFNMTFLFRVIRQKGRMCQNRNWTQYRKIIMQMFGISLLHLFTNMPYYMMVFLALINVSLYQYSLEPYFVMLLYITSTILPFVCLASLPELWKKFHFFSNRIKITTIAFITPTPFVRK